MNDWTVRTQNSLPLHPICTPMYRDADMTSATTSDNELATNPNRKLAVRNDRKIRRFPREFDISGVKWRHDGFDTRGTKSMP
jgi:hypothetical protein